MFRISRHRPWPAMVDLATIRETLDYIKSDADRVPGLESVSKALADTIREVDKAEAKVNPKPLTPLTAKFLPRRRF